VTADEVSAEQRRYAKAINFGLIYGMGAFGLAQQPGHRAARRPRDYIERYFARYPGVQHLHGRDPARWPREQGYVETVFGRRLWLPEINGGNGPRRAGRRARRPSTRRCRAPRPT
jgi:DNA polymerase-1